MTTISADGTSQAIYLRMNGADVEYSIGSLTTPASYTIIGSWPVTITNTPSPGPSTILRMVATENLTISGSTGGTSGYFKPGSAYVTFDGSGNTILISGISAYLGFIQSSTYAYISVQNFITDYAVGSTLASNAGWLCQNGFGSNTLGNSVTNCTNNAPINATGGGGLGGRTCGSGSTGSLTFTNCTNNGELVFSGSILATGGIVGVRAGYSGGSITFINCTNNGAINSNNSGGIIGGSGGGLGGSVTIIGCTNTGNIGSTTSGGIVGERAGTSGGLATIRNCCSTGNISGNGSGGIAGSLFGADTSLNCVISGSFSTGNISGAGGGGIIGTFVAQANTATSTPVVDVSNCYSLGTIATTTGGICGSGATYAYPSTLRITNCYSYGTLVDASSGIIALGLPTPNLTITLANTYVADGTWSDASANASGALLGYPTSLTTNNPGTTWATLGSNTPYILYTGTALYSPSSISSFLNYTTSQGLVQNGGTYTLVNTSQVNNVATIRVLVSKGTAPKYYAYTFNTFTMTNLNGGTGRSIAASINSSTGVLDIILPYPCFLEGTNILCFENNQEVYRPIEGLRKGDLVKTINNGYQPIHMIGTTTIYNPGNDYRITNRLYKCSTEKYPDLFEDLYITGCHSILVPWMTPDQWENTKAVNGDVFVTDNHFRLIACADEKAEPYNKEGYVNIYHIALEHREYYMNYGIYANGLLVESCSKRYLMELSNMRILGVNHTLVSEKAEADAEMESLETNIFHKMPKMIDIC